MKRAAAVLVVALLAPAADAAISVYTADFIADATRSAFNGFEGLPAPGTGGVLANGVLVLNNPSDATYAESGIRVEQVFSAFIAGEEMFGIWTTFFPSEGTRGWYPNGGDDGYTRITRSGGGDFTAVGLIAWGGVSGADRYLYILREHGATVLEGYVAKPDGHSYLGFAGGGFDEVLIRTAESRFTTGFFDGGANGFGVDAIEAITAIPEPATPMLLVASIGSLSLFWRRRAPSRRIECTVQT